MSDELIKIDQPLSRLWINDKLEKKDQAGLSATAKEVLEQIDKKHYDTDMRDRGITEIVK